jgi:hypothetical protein
MVAGLSLTILQRDLNVGNNLTHIISPVAVVTTGVYYCYCYLHELQHEKHNYCLLLFVVVVLRPGSHFILYTV